MTQFSWFCLSFNKRTLFDPKTLSVLSSKIRIHSTKKPKSQQNRKKIVQISKFNKFKDNFWAISRRTSFLTKECSGKEGFSWIVVPSKLIFFLASKTKLNKMQVGILGWENYYKKLESWLGALEFALGKNPLDFALYGKLHPVTCDHNPLNRSLNASLLWP